MAKKPERSTFQTILLVDTTEREQVSLALVKNGKLTKQSVTVRAQELPKLIEELLVKTKTEFGDLDALAVCVKPGSLTGVRIGVTTINTLAWLKELPVLELQSENFIAALKELKNVAAKQIMKQARVSNEVVY